MFYCSLCENETCYISKFCSKCRKIKHYLNLYNERVYEVLDNVLSRDIDKQNNNISTGSTSQRGGGSFPTDQKRLVIPENDLIGYK